MMICMAVSVFISRERPMLSSSDNNIQFFNEFCILFLCVLSLCFTDFVPDPEARYTIGLWFLLFTLGNIGINILMIVYSLKRNF